MSEERAPYTATSIPGIPANEAVHLLLEALETTNRTVVLLATALANALEQRNLALAEIERLQKIVNGGKTS